MKVKKNKLWCRLGLLDANFQMLRYGLLLICLLFFAVLILFNGDYLNGIILMTFVISFSGLFRHWVLYFDSQFIFVFYWKLKGFDKIPISSISKIEYKMPKAYFLSPIQVYYKDNNGVNRKGVFEVGKMKNFPSMLNFFIEIGLQDKIEMKGFEENLGLMLHDDKFIFKKDLHWILKKENKS
jgi:hypothetical protein